MNREKLKILIAQQVDLMATPGMDREKALANIIANCDLYASSKYDRKNDGTEVPEFTETLYALKEEVISKIKESFTDITEEVFFNDTVQSIEDHDREIIGILKGPETTSLLMSESGSIYTDYTPLEKCEIQDLIYVYDQLSSKQYSHTRED